MHQATHPHQHPHPRPLVLRNLPLAARLTLAVFLISVGIGYLSALVQLHFQHASPGAALPTPDDAVRIFHGEDARPVSTIERLIMADESKPWNGSGQMSRAFTTKSEDWRQANGEKVKALSRQLKGLNKDAVKAAAEVEVRKEREGERDAVVVWVRAGANLQDYKKDNFVLPSDLAAQPVTDAYLVKLDDQPVEPRAVKIKSILQDRCARCHTPDADPKAGVYPLDSYEHLKPYVTVKASSAMSLEKLAQTTHVHLLGFSMLYGLTGLILAFSSYPRFVRLLLCPLPLVAQVVDISFWWLARLDAPHGPAFARCIAVSGTVVAVGLLLHLVLALWDLFRMGGKLVLVLLAAAAAYGGYVAKEKVIDPHIAQEAKPAAPDKE
jgi:hypothetical protein